MSDDVAAYRAAEQAYLRSEGLEATERVVDMDRLGGQVRILDVEPGTDTATDSQPPVLFIPGVMTTGAVFAGLAARLNHVRCLLLDRPGTGLSPVGSPPPADLAAQRHHADHLVADVLDGLDIQVADLVCTSLGGFAGFRSAANAPERIGRISALAYQVGARPTDAPLSMRLPVPTFLMPRRVKISANMVRTMLKTGGMRAAIENDKFSDEMLAWMAALLRHTDTFRNDVRYSPRPAGIAGPVEAVRHSPELLARVTSHVHLLWGSDDLFGDESSATEFAGQLPNAELQMVPGAGHAPWFDEPDLAGKAVSDHLHRP